MTLKGRLKIRLSDKGLKSITILCHSAKFAFLPLLAKNANLCGIRFGFLRQENNKSDSGPLRRTLRVSWITPPAKLLGVEGITAHLQEQKRRFRNGEEFRGKEDKPLHIEENVTLPIFNEYLFMIYISHLAPNPRNSMMNFTTIKEKIWDFVFEGLWMEGPRLFFTYWRNWLLGSLLFWALINLLDVLVDRFPLPYHIWLIPQIFLLALLIYFFTVCFLNQEPITQSLHVNIRQFGKAFFYAVLFIIVWPGIYAVTILSVSSFGELLSTFLVKLIGMNRFDAFMLLVPPLLIAAIVFVVWTICRLPFVTPLAAQGIKSPFMTSWALTKGKGWRLAGNIYMLSFIVSPMVAFFDKINARPATAAEEVILTGLFSAFACGTCRILYGEDIASHLEHDRRSAPRA